MEFDFKKGDRVKIIDPFGSTIGKKGDTGILISIGHSPNPDKSINIYSVNDTIQMKRDSDGEIISMYPIRFEKITGGNVMKLEDLKTGMVVKTRVGKTYVVAIDCKTTSYNYKAFALSTEGDSGFRIENDKLTNSISDFDIIEVYSITYMSDIARVLKGDKVNMSLVWKRENTKEQQLKELITKLEGQLSEAKAELKKI